MPDERYICLQAQGVIASHSAHGSGDRPSWSGSHGKGDLHQITSHENVTMGLENEFSCPVWAFAS